MMMGLLRKSDEQRFDTVFLFDNIKEVREKKTHGDFLHQNPYLISLIWGPQHGTVGIIKNTLQRSEYFRPLRFLSLILIFLLFFLPFASGSVEESGISNQSLIYNKSESSSPDIRINAVDMWKSGLSNSDKKISSDLLSLLDQGSLNPGINLTHLIGTMQENGNIETNESLISDITGTGKWEKFFVYIEMFPGNSTTIVDPYLRSVVDRDETNAILAAWVGRDEIRPVSQLDGVRFIYPVTPPFTNTGSVTTEGDAIHRSDLVRAQPDGPIGTGIKIGIISDGVDHRNDSIATGDLPTDFQVLSNNCGGEEGIAMGEIIYDISPGSDLAFADATNNSIGMARNMQVLADAGCQIIVDDISHFDEPFFEDGILAKKADSLYQHNILMISSAGNHAKKNFIGDYVSLNRSPYMDFSSVGNASDHPTPNNPNLYCKIDPKQTASIILQWDDRWGSSGNDYDLYLLDDPGNILASSTNVQEGTGDPFEMIQFNNVETKTIEGTIKVKLRSGVPKKLQVMIFGATTYRNNLVESSSTYGHPCSAGTMGVAAIPYNNITMIEEFSSHGPRIISYPIQESRLKPDISGIDDVQVTGAGGFGYKDGNKTRFPGTSASAPHIAGIGALLWSKNPHLPVDAIRSALTSTAVDLGGIGFDPIFGYGRADALAAYMNITPTSLVANFSASPVSGTPPLQVQFTDTSSGQPCSWNWTFGDGSTSYDQNPVHMYSGIGRYTVTLEVANGKGRSVMRKPSLITPNAGNVTGPNGMIWITSSPSDAQVFADGNYLGTTPLHSSGMPAGIHQIRVSREGYRDWTGYIRVNQGMFTYVPKVVLTPGLPGS